MAQDPVLQREMFNPRDRSARGSGITSMVDDGSSGMTREERMQMAKDMLAEAQMKQNPEYYFNTLAQGDRPAMTRPVASSAPPPAMQPMPAAQQMAQMQAAGVRPVGMADGGIVRIGYAHGGLHSEDEEFIPGLEALKSNPAWSNLTFDQRSQLTTDLYNRVAVERPEAQSRPTIDVLTPEYLGSEDAEKFSGNLTDQSNLSPIELEARAVRAKDKYYKDMALQIFKQQTGGDYVKGKQSSTAFGRFFDQDDEVRDRLLTDIEKDLRLKDARAGSDTVENAGNIFKVETPSERSSRKEKEKLAEDNLRKYGTAEAPNDPARLKIAEQDFVAKGGMGGIGGLRPDFVEARKRAEDNARDTEDYARDDAMQNQRNTFEARREANEIQRIADNNRDYATQDASNAARASQNAADNARETSRGIAMLDVGERNTAEARRLPDNVRLRPPVTGVPGAAVAKAQDPAGAAKDQAGASAQEPARYSATTTLESIKSDRAKEREDNFNLSLIQAGLAMMGGKSSNALANIGEGGMQGIKQFSEQERESSRGYREDVKGVRDEERFGREMSQRERMQETLLSANAEDARLGRLATSDLADATRKSTKAMFDRSEDRLDRTEIRNDLEAVFARGLATKDQELKEKYQNGTISAQEYANLTARNSAESTANYQAASIRMDERKQKLAETKPPEEVLNAAFFGGWRPDDKGTAPTDEQLMAGLAKMNEIDLNKSLEKIINSPFADQELRDKAAVQYGANLAAIAAKNPQAFKEGATATNAAGKKIIFKSGTWVEQ